MSQVNLLVQSNKTEHKQLGTVETLNVLLAHRKILSDCIREMDSQAVNYIPEQAIFQRLKAYTALVKPDVKRRLRIALSTSNLLQANIVMDVDGSQGEQRLYFQSSVLEVIRLCDVSLFKKLTDVQLKSHLVFLNQAQQSMSSGQLNYRDDDADFVEFMDNLFMHIGRLLSDIRQNVIKMQTIGKELERLTSHSVKHSPDPQGYIEAKQLWLDEIVRLYERHIMPILQFLNPDTTYADNDGLHVTLVNISQQLENHEQRQLGQSCQAYALSFLNFYRPIELTANAVNRFIHKQRDSLQRFNALEHYYQNTLMKALTNTFNESLTKTKLGNEGVVLSDFVANNKGFRRPMGYGFNDSPAYYKNMFNELDARTEDALHLGDMSEIDATAHYSNQAELRMLRYEALCQRLAKMALRPTDDLIAVLHRRLHTEFAEYALYDLISAVQFMRSSNAYTLKTTNIFGQLDYQNITYTYRKIKCRESL